MPITTKRPVGVTLLAIMYLWIGGGGTLIFPFMMLLGSASLLGSALFAGSIQSETASKALSYLLSAVLYAGYVAYLLLGIGLWRMRNRARVAAIAINISILGLALVLTPIIARPLSAGIPILIATSIPFLLIAWYLHRPRVRFAFGVGPDPDAGSIPKVPRRLTKTGIVWIVAGAIAAVGLFVGGIFVLVETAFHSSVPYQTALKVARSSSCVTNALGAPWNAQWAASGAEDETGDDGTAKLSIPVTGPAGSGSLELEATKSNNVWQIDSLVLEHRIERIHLAPVADPCP